MIDGKEHKKQPTWPPSGMPVAKSKPIYRAVNKSIVGDSAITYPAIVDCNAFVDWVSFYKKIQMCMYLP